MSETVAASPFEVVELSRAVCACGARGPARATILEARADAAEHWRRHHRAGLGVCVIGPCVMRSSETARE